MEKTGCKIICGAPTTLAVKGLMMMMKVKKKINVHDFGPAKSACVVYVGALLLHRSAGERGAK